ncbi:AAA family ATPase [Croceicoccus sp. Ery5]|uniref:AAA family ATPase n=1 Tax=Croceicoccus sp. Ery5 TaxID=1703340 RepID=UPI00351CB8B7
MGGCKLLIKSLTAKNFRTLEDFKVSFRSGYCTLSGQNNAGKSAIVRIIEYFLQNRHDEVAYVPGGISI